MYHRFIGSVKKRGLHGTYIEWCVWILHASCGIHMRHWTWMAPETSVFGSMSGHLWLQYCSCRMQYDNTVEGSVVFIIQQGQLSISSNLYAQNLWVSEHIKLEIAMGGNLIQIYVEELSQEPNWIFFPSLLLSEEPFKVWFKFLRNN